LIKEIATSRRKIKITTINGKIEIKDKNKQALLK
jgi:hypothetical protein